jgi:TM2 domain-containing membrane protein YozV
MKQSGIAGVLSFLIPGLGQIYNGDFLRAIFWFVVSATLWLVMLGWVCHLVAAYTAYHRGARYMRGEISK